MTPEQIFSMVNLLAVGGWLILVFAGRRRWAAELVTSAVVPLLLAVIYSGLILGHWGGSQGGFGSIAEVQMLFANPWLLLAGWIHYLAFDLFVGSWEARDAQKHGISHWVVIPCLVLTFIFGPVGFLAYFAVRWGKTQALTIG